ncbi:hypothetical protein Csa_009583 [Cucumis sativus]|uniref:Uncharacterized protein n=1 Tax=Cucumis sativus TaxID=3659 RepID=A0A0A0L4D2_CUCSA|nr:hypothetical protein Csa_009583 [Cucumis sativus]
MMEKGVEPNEVRRRQRWSQIGRSYEEENERKSIDHDVKQPRRRKPCSGGNAPTSATTLKYRRRFSQRPFVSIILQIRRESEIIFNGIKQKIAISRQK